MANSQGMQVYPPGQGPVTEQVIPQHMMGLITPQSPLKAGSEGFVESGRASERSAGSPTPFGLRKDAHGLVRSRQTLLPLEDGLLVTTAESKMAETCQDGQDGPRISPKFAFSGATTPSSLHDVTKQPTCAGSAIPNSLNKAAVLVPLALGAAGGGPLGGLTAPSGSRFEGAGKGMAVGAGTVGGMFGGSALGKVLGRMAAQGLRMDPDTAARLGELIGATGGGFAGYKGTRALTKGKDEEKRAVSPYFTPREGGEAVVENQPDGSIVERWTRPPRPIRERAGLVRKVLKEAAIGSHGVPLVSTSPTMQRSTAGEGDISGLKVAPWTVNGADAWRDLAQHQGSSGGKGVSAFGGKMAPQVERDNPPVKGYKSASLGD
ncbi:hypothetical protein LCGC14_2579690, partial [marine sediment metagenome]